MCNEETILFYLQAEGGYDMQIEEWILCPVCGNKTPLKMRTDMLLPDCMVG
jgi:hypothetical protein